jgi:type IV secretion system protein VirD4
LTTISEGTSGDRPKRGADDWSALPLQAPEEDAAGSIAGPLSEEDCDNSGIRREPTLPEHEAIATEDAKPNLEFALLDDEPDDEAVRASTMRQRLVAAARQAALDPDDGIQL